MIAVRLFTSAAVLAASLAGSQVAAQPARPGPGAGVEIAVTAGLFQPTEDSVRRVYEGGRIPWAVDGDVRVRGRLSVFAGARFLKMDGRVSGIDPAVGVGTDTRLSTSSLRFGARVDHRWGALGLLAGLGAARTSYTETWPGVAAEFSGSAWGLLIQGGVVYRATRHVGVTGRVDWFRARTGEGSLLDEKVDVGGGDLMAGVVIRF